MRFALSVARPLLHRRGAAPILSAGQLIVCSRVNRVKFANEPLQYNSATIAVLRTQ